MADYYFDQHAERFQRNIYNTPKGKLRLDLLWRDLSDFIPWLQGDTPRRILDIGAGQGQLAMQLTRHGHAMTLCEPAANMLDMARQNFARELPQAEVDYIEAPLQQLDDHLAGQFDLVLCHAVFEWLEDADAMLPRLCQWLAPGGYLSLMVYNLNSLIMKNLLRGNFYKVESGDYRGEEGSLTPPHPQLPETVEAWLTQQPLQILRQSGIRVVYDYLPKAVAQQRSYEDILAIEQRYSLRPPFARMGRYSHWLCQASSA